MNGSDPLAAAGLGVVERVARDALGGVPGDELDGLNDTVDNLANILSVRHARTCPPDTMTHLVLNTRVLALRFLTNEHRVDVVVGSLEALDGNTRPDVGEEVECPSEGKVEGNVTLSD